jgi:hypothetical protein
MAGSSRPSTFSYALIEAMNEGHCGLPTEEQDGGTHVGTVDKVEGGHLKILRPDQRPRISTNMSRRIGWLPLMIEFGLISF